GHPRGRLLRGRQGPVGVHEAPSTTERGRGLTPKHTTHTTPQGDPGSTPPPGPGGPALPGPTAEAEPPRPVEHRPLPADLTAFLDAGAPPVHVGFGSMAAYAPHPMVLTLRPYPSARIGPQRGTGDRRLSGARRSTPRRPGWRCR